MLVTDPDRTGNMTDEKQKYTVTCANRKCGKYFNVSMQQAILNRKLTCPHCGKKHEYDLLQTSRNNKPTSYSQCVDVTPTKDTTYTLTAEDAAGHVKTETLTVKVR